MKIYRVHYQSHENSSVGHDFFSSKKEADKSLSDYIKEDKTDHFGSIDIIDFRMNKTGILEALYIAGHHANNG
jgi:hypothetical protein